MSQETDKRLDHARGAGEPLGHTKETGEPLDSARETDERLGLPRETWDRIEQLDELAMVHEVAVIPFSAGDYLDDFYDFFEIKDRGPRLTPSPESFRERLRELAGDGRWQPIAERAEEFFGTPWRVAEFDDDTALREELEGPDGLAPFFFVFDLVFCEYEDLTLCFMSGTNN